jgi:hypothetical protein
VSAGITEMPKGSDVKLGSGYCWWNKS